MPIAIGTASTSANTELSTVTMNRSQDTEPPRCCASVVLNSALVKKLASLARSEGTARINKEDRDQRDRDDDGRAGSGRDALNSRSPSRPCRRDP